MSEFKRGISGDFIEALKRLAGQDGWWRDVLDDPTLIIAVRDEYLNVYWQGQSIFKVSFEHEIAVSTHPKYLLNPDLSGQVALSKGAFDLSAIESQLLTRTYMPGVSLGRLKRAAGLYSGKEKEGVHAIAMSNTSIVDVEIALNANGLATKRTLPRIDLAAFELSDAGVNLAFWEAKIFNNPEARSTEVANQIRDYQTVIKASQQQILNSYKCVARNLVDIAAMSNGKRKLSETITRVAHNRDELIVSEANIGLIVYGFDAAQRDRKDVDGLTLKEKLTARLRELKIDDRRIKFKGEAKRLII